MASQSPPARHEPRKVNNSFEILRAKNLILSATTEIGRRKSQEDRFVVCTEVGHEGITLLGVFDGTVGSFASDFVHASLPRAVMGARDFADLIASEEAAPAEIERISASILRESFAEVDRALLKACVERGGLDYTSSTAVVALIAHGVLTVAHVGDSKVVLATETTPEEPLRATSMTVDHKPDQAAELQRIERAGGCLTYLHGGKPFIRGGDFTQRQAIGDRPMQLNYSRAFGGKDLKNYGLSADPDVAHVRINSKHRMLVLASDGVWDVLSAEEAVDCAVTAVADGRNPSRAVVLLSCQTHDARQSADNVTCIIAFFNPAGARAKQTQR